MDACSEPRGLRPLLGLLLLAGGCMPDVSISGEARIGCGGGDGCPDGYVCKPAIGRCLLAEASDQEPPALDGVAEVEPQAGGLGTEFSVCFSVTEPLAEPPVVWLDVGSRVAPLAPAADAGDPAPLRHCYGYAIDGSEAAGIRPLSVDLLDLGGNTAQGLALGNLVLDFAPPKLVADAVPSERYLKADVVTEVRLVYDEELDGVPEVSMRHEEESDDAPGLPWEESWSEDDRTFVLVYRARGDEVQGDYYVSLAGSRDAAGNTSEPQDLGWIRLDFVAPGIVEVPGVSVDPAFASELDVVTVQVPLDEEVPPAGPYGDGPRLVARPLDGLPLVFEGGDGGRDMLHFSHVVGHGRDATYTLVLSGLVDRAGNELGETEVGELVVDTEDPHPLDFWQSHRELNAGDVFEVRFRTSEALAEQPTVRLRHHDMERVDGRRRSLSQHHRLIAPEGSVGRCRELGRQRRGRRLSRTRGRRGPARQRLAANRRRQSGRPARHLGPREDPARPLSGRPRRAALRRRELHRRRQPGDPRRQRRRRRRRVGRSLPAVPPLRGGPLTSRRDLLHTRLTMPERLHALSLGDIFPEDPVDFDSTTRPVEPK